MSSAASDVYKRQFLFQQAQYLIKEHRVLIFMEIRNEHVSPAAELTSSFKKKKNISLLIIFNDLKEKCLL